MPWESNDITKMEKAFQSQCQDLKDNLLHTLHRGANDHLFSGGILGNPC